MPIPPLEIDPGDKPEPSLTIKIIASIVLVTIFVFFVLPILIRFGREMWSFALG